MSKTMIQAFLIEQGLKKRHFSEKGESAFDFRE